ncbi:MAG: tetratricopeptide repeat protein, partial [Aeoliella sp.]
MSPTKIFSRSPFLIPHPHFMTAEEFITALEAKQLLPKPMVEKLRQKTSSESKPLSAKSLARFLIDKGHLSKHQAMAVLASGGEVKSSVPKSTPKEEPKAAEHSGIEFPDDELQDLSSSAEWSVDEGGGFAEAAATESAIPTTKSKKRKRKKENEWDSPLLLIGGGSLVLLLIVGGVVAFILNAEGADKTLEEARNAMNDGSYGKGIANYQQFVEKWPSHSDFSSARVELAMAQIRQMVESGNHSKALETTNTELRLIGGESAFNEAQEQLSELLPRIARALADKAEASEDVDESKKLFEEAKSALGLTNNTKYIPKSRRDKTELEGIRQTIDRIERRQESMTDLTATLDVIEKAIVENDTQTAYAAQQALVEKHPALATNTKLADALVN